jgi:hypothetical protein
MRADEKVGQHAGTHPAGPAIAAERLPGKKQALDGDSI